MTEVPPETILPCPVADEAAPVEERFSPDMIREQKVSWLERSSWICAIVGTVFVIAATVIGLIELGHVRRLISEIQQTNRVSETLRYDSRYKSDPLLQYARQLRDVWFSSEGQQLWQGSSSERAKFVTDQSLNDAVLSIADFYDDLYVCIDNNLCDLPLVLQLLSRDIEAFYVLNHPFLKAYDEDMPSNLACGIDALIKPAQLHLQAVSHGTLSEDEPTGSLARGACRKL